MSMTASQQRERRARYDNFYKELISCPIRLTPAIGGLKLDENLFRTITPANGKQFAKVAYHSNVKSDSSISRYLFFGEVTADNNETRMGARGNLVDSDTVAVDGTKIKDNLGLRPITACGLNLMNTWDNQVVTVTEIVEKEEEGGYEVMSPVFSRDAASGVTIRFVSEQKYKPLPGSTAGGSRVAQKRNLLECDDSGATSDPVDAEPEGLPDGFYEPDVLPDFDPDYIRFKRHKLVRLPYFDAQRAPIEPQNVLSEIREGTLVLVEANVLVWMPTLRKKVVQLLMKHVRVIAPSELPLPYLVVRSASEAVGSDSAPGSPPWDLSDQFTAFNSGSSVKNESVPAAPSVPVTSAPAVDWRTLTDDSDAVMEPPSKRTRAKSRAVDKN